MVTTVTNEAASKVALFGTESIAGQAVVPTARLRGTFQSNINRALRRTEEATGAYDRMTEIDRETPTFDGTYSEPLSFESYPSMMRYGVEGGGMGVSDGNDIAAYTYAKSPAPNVDNIDTMTVNHGIEGLAYQSTGVRWDEFTIAGNAVGSDSNWMFNASAFLRNKTRLPGHYTGLVTSATGNTLTVAGANWTINQWVGAYVYLDYGSHMGAVRRVLSNTATVLTLEPPALSPAPTAGDVFHLAGLLPIVDEVPGHEPIKVEGTELFLDRWSADDRVIGTTNVSERVVSFNVTHQLNLQAKTRLPGRIGRVGRGTRWITGTIVFEHDRWDEYKGWEEDDWVSIRIRKDGSIIDPAENTRKRAQIDVEKAAWDMPTEGTEGANMTLALTFVAALPIASPNPIAEFLGINTIPVLP